MKSEKGRISSRKVIVPPTFPTAPLYIQVIRNPAIGAHTTSENSPKKGTIKDTIPMASNTIPRIRFRFLLLFDSSWILFRFFSSIVLRFQSKDTNRSVELGVGSWEGIKP